MTWTPDSIMNIGQVLVTTTKDGGRPPEWFAEQIVDRLIYVGEKAPEPIKAQALAFRDKMMVIVLAGIKEAIESDRIYRK